MLTPQSAVVRAALLVATTTFTCAHVPKSLQNPSFENELKDWTVSGNQIVRSADPNYPASDGSRVLVFNPYGSLPTARLSQTVLTTPGQRYELAFDLGTVLATADQRLHVTVTGDGLLLDHTIEVAGISALPFVIPQHFSFVANSQKSTIAFEDQSYIYVGIDSFLDNVQIVPQHAQAPVLTAQPVRTSAAVGNNARFSAAASGTDLRYQWQFNGTDIEGATGDSYTVAGVSEDNAGNYSVVVSNGFGSMASSGATLTVLPQGILLNGSFEYGVSGWTFSNSSVTTSTNTSFGVTDGTQLVHFNWGQQKPDGVLSQAFSTSIGRPYRLEFDVGAFSLGYTHEQRLRVRVVGATTLISKTISMFAPGNGSRYHPESFDFVADSPTTTLYFEDESPTSDSVDIVLDNVRVALQAVHASSGRTQHGVHRRLLRPPAGRS